MASDDERWHGDTAKEAPAIPLGEDVAIPRLQNGQRGLGQPSHIVLGQAQQVGGQAKGKTQHAAQLKFARRGNQDQLRHVVGMGNGIFGCHRAAKGMAHQHKAGLNL
jgi:hypothetical protein